MSNKNDIRIALISLFNLDLGIRYISSFFKANGYSTYIISFNKQRRSVEFLGNDYFTPRVINHKICHQRDLDLLISLLEELRVRIVGISLTSVTMQTARMITLEIKKHLDVIVVWGGIHAIIAPEECIQYADIVCVGEGEIPMLELAEKVRRNEPIGGIKNLWIKKRNEIEKNEMRELIENLDELAFPDFMDRDNKFLIDGGEMGKDPHIISAYQKGAYPIMTSRGCFYNCSFCCNSVLKDRYKGRGKYYRRRSAENVIAELKYVIQNRYIYMIRFWDDVFTFDAQWIDKFCSQYIKEIGKPFTCYAYPKNTDKDILIKLKRAGLILVDIGIQSGSEEVSKQLFSRVQSNQDSLTFAHLMKKLWVTVQHDIITDNPYETDQDQKITTDLLMQLPYPFQIQFYSLCWFPETFLTKRALTDRIITTKDLEQYTSKALNNFYMYIPLSKGKQNYFWNCVKAMAVNRFFPKFLVRFCRKNKFFKKYPKILFLLARNYLLLFSRWSLGWEKRRIIIRKKIPWNLGNLIIYRDSNIINENYIVGDARWLFRNPMIEFSFFPLSGSKENREFCLRIRNMLGRERFFNIMVRLASFKEYTDNPTRKSIWLMEFPIGSNYQTDVYISLSYPELFYSIDKYQYKSRLLKAQISKPLNNGIYLLQLLIAKRPNIVIDNVLFEV